jgi:TetR/AcrR family transcriptional regulator
MTKWADQGLAREQLREVRRERILQAAARCFSRKGYRGTTIDDIARRLDVSTAALYYYFRSKEELLFACHQMSHDIGMEGLRRAEACGGPADERLRAALRYYIEHTTDEFHGCVASIDEQALSRSRHRQVVARRDEYERNIRRLIDEGVASNVFVRCDVGAVTLAILGAVSWIPKWYQPKGRCSGKEIARIFSTYLVRGLQAAPAMADDMRLNGAGDAPPSDGSAPRPSGSMNGKELT